MSLPPPLRRGLSPGCWCALPRWQKAAGQRSFLPGGWDKSPPRLFLQEHCCDLLLLHHLLLLQAHKWTQPTGRRNFGSSSHVRPRRWSSGCSSTCERPPSRCVVLLPHLRLPAGLFIPLPYSPLLPSPPLPCPDRSDYPLEFTVEGERGRETDRERERQGKRGKEGGERETERREGGQRGTEWGGRQRGGWRDREGGQREREEETERKGWEKERWEIEREKDREREGETERGR